MTRLLRPLLLAAILMPLAAACTMLPSLGPSYRSPNLNLPGAYREGKVAQLTSSTLPYWQRLNDPVLTSLAQQALAANLDIQQAAERVKQARAGAAMAWGALGPSVQAQGGYQGQRIGAQANLINGTTQTLDIFSAGVGASWELDLLGGTRRAVESANSRADAAAAMADGTRSMVVAEVARQYATFRALQRQTLLAEQQVSATAVLAEKTAHQARVGLVDGAVLAAAQSRHHAMQARLPQLRAARDATRYTLEALTGQQTGALATTLATTLAGSAPMPAVPVSASLVLPSELVTLRPDLRAREAAAHAATAEVGVAMADLFPRFSLSGTYGAQAASAGNLGEGSSLVWSGGPSFRWTLFAMGQVWNNVNLQQSRRKEAVLAYQQAVLDALAEVESRLAQYNAGLASAEATAKLAANGATQATLARARHHAGALNGAQLQQATLIELDTATAHTEAQLAALLAYINLHQAFGL